MDKDPVDYAFHIALLIRKQRDGTLLPDERKKLEHWSEADPRNKQLLDDAMRGDELAVFEAAYFSVNTADALQRVKQRFAAPKRTIRQVRNWIPYVAALLVFTVLVGLWMGIGDQRGHAERMDPADVRPGGNRATLTLSDGRTVRLSEEHGGIIVGDDVSYLDGSEISRNVAHTPDGTATAMSLSTPPGGTYQITLSDGTCVWLNAESTLNYPSRFANDERVVEVRGEAYFAVKGDANWPFKVVSKGQTVEVLGTEFNISAYPDAGDIQTTLVEGRVTVMPTAMPGIPIHVKPGQQVRIGDQESTVMDVDIAPYTAWREGYFVFKGTALMEAMQQLGRWYDVDVTYAGEAPKIPFYGKISRQSRLSEVLDILRAGEVKFRVERQNDRTRILVLQEGTN